VLSKYLQDGCHESRGVLVSAITEQVSALDRHECSSSSNLAIWDLAFTEPDRDEPRIVWGPQSHFRNCQFDLFVLIALTTGNACLGKTGNKREGVIRDRASDFCAPVCAWPQVGRIPPHWHTGGFECLLQLVNLVLQSRFVI
jgi:hypothetical protein